MDVSKLPKLSDTKTAGGGPQAPSPVEPADAVPYRNSATPRPVPVVGADVWVSAVIGLLFVSLGFTFARFAVAKLTRQPFHTGVEWQDPDPRAGQEVAYFDLQGYTAWTDMGVFLFGVTLLFEAASKAAVVLRPGTLSRGLLVAAMGLTLATVVLNLYVCVLLQRYGVTPTMSGLAVAFGGWVLYDEWHTLLAARPSPGTTAG